MQSLLRQREEWQQQGKQRKDDSPFHIVECLFIVISHQHIVQLVVDAVVALNAHGFHRLGHLGAYGGLVRDLLSIDDSLAIVLLVVDIKCG